MSVFVPLLDGAQAEIVYEFNRSKIMSNRLWFIFDNPPITQVALDGLAAGLNGWFNTKVLPHLSSEITYAATKAYDWTADPPPFISGAGLSALGGSASPTHSANVAVRVNLRWPTAMRQRMNCNFVPGVPQSGVNLNTLESTFANNIWSAYADLIDDTRLFSPILNWRWVVTSQFDAGAARTSQLWGECIGPVRPERLKLGQRRTRLRP
jgi:hypothetical protein